MVAEETARKLAAFVANLKYEDIPTAAVEKAKQFFLDMMRLCVIGSRLPWGEQICKVFRQIGGKEESTVIFFGDRLPAIHAAFVNGTTAHILENDDTHVAAIHHPGVTVIPAVLAVAERQNLGGKDLLAAMIAGYEVMIRLGVALQPSLFRDRGFHATAVIGHFGAAAGSANLLKLPTDPTAHGLAFAAAYASGLGNWVKGGGVKYIHAGKAAKAGVEAALLAACGLTGPRQIFEGKRGFCEAYAARYDLKRITSGLGEEWKILEVHLKPHCTSRHTQAAIEAAARLADENEISPEDIASMDIITSPEMAEALSTITPVDVIEAQSSIPFATATGLFKGGARTLKEYVLFEDIKEAMGNPAVKSFLQRISLRGNADFDVQKGNAQVILHLKGGQVYQKRVDVIHGSPEDPFTLEELKKRFFTQAKTALPNTKLLQAAERICSLEDVKNVKEITRLLCTEDREMAVR